MVYPPPREIFVHFIYRTNHVLFSRLFAPPAALLYRAAKEGDSAVLKLVRNLSALWLALTLVLLIVNFLSAFGSEVLGNILYYVLIIVTSPMICSGHWAMSMFCWACLLMVSLRELRKSK